VASASSGNWDATADNPCETPSPRSGLHLLPGLVLVFGQINLKGFRQLILRPEPDVGQLVTEAGAQGSDHTKTRTRRRTQAVLGPTVQILWNRRQPCRRSNSAEWRQMLSSGVDRERV
jgi:hypothetical protein